MLLEWLDYWGAPGREKPDGGPYLKLDPFSYNIEFNTLGASATATGNFAVEQSVDFVIRYAQQQVETGGAVIAVPRVLAQLRDPGSGRTLMNAPTMMANIFGIGQLPFIWPEPRVVKGGSNFAAILTDISAAANRINLAFSGFKIFWFDAQLRKQFYETV